MIFKWSIIIMNQYNFLTIWKEYYTDPVILSGLSVCVCVTDVGHCVINCIGIASWIRKYAGPILTKK